MIHPPDTPSTHSRLALAIIFMTVLLDMIGFGIVIPILPLYSEKLGASPLEAGLLMGSYSLMQLIFTPLLGQLSDRVGRRPVLFFSLLGTALGYIILGFGTTLWVLFLGRMIDGISGGNISTAQAYIADISKPEERSQRMGLMGAAFGLGFILGPAIGGIFSQYGMHWPFLIAAVLSLVNAGVLWFFLPESLNPASRTPAGQADSWKTLLKTIHPTAMTIILCSFLTILPFTMVTSLFTLFTQAQYNMRPADNGWLFAYIGLISAIVQGGLLSRFIRWFGEKILVLVGLGLMIISFWGLPVVHSEQGLWLLSGLMALGNGLVTPVYNGLVSRYATPFQQGSVLGLMQGLGSLGRLMGPVIAGWLMAWQAMMNPRHQATYGEWAFHTACMMVLATGFIALFRLPATQRSPGNVESN